MEIKYKQCKNCWFISEKQNDSAVNCPACGGSDFSDWPTIEVKSLFSLIHEKEGQNPFEYQLIASVFCSAAFELLLEQLLFIMAIEDLLYEEVGHLVEKLMDSNQGKSKRINLYRRLGYGSFSEESSALGYPSFLNDWDELTSVRNQCVHGKIPDKETITPKFTNKLIEDGLKVFSGLYNKYNMETIQFNVGLDRYQQKKLDLDLLKNWIEGKPMNSELFERKRNVRKNRKIDEFFD